MNQSIREGGVHSANEPVHPRRWGTLSEWTSPFPEGGTPWMDRSLRGGTASVNGLEQNFRLIRFLNPDCSNLDWFTQRQLRPLGCTWWRYSSSLWNGAGKLAEVNSIFAQEVGLCIVRKWLHSKSKIYLREKVYLHIHKVEDGEWAVVNISTQMTQSIRNHSPIVSSSFDRIRNHSPAIFNSFLGLRAKSPAVTRLETDSLKLGTCWRQ
jgi:hypothetical protein